MGLLSQMGIPISGNGILHPRQKYRWQVQFINIAQGTAAASNYLSAQAVNVTRPQFEFEEVQLDRYNSRAYVLGKYTFSPMTLTIEDDISGLATSVIQSQVELQQRLIGADSSNAQWLNSASTASSYKFGMKLMSLDGNETVTETWSYEGCMIQAVDYNDYDYTASDAAQITMTVRYDIARQDIAGVQTGTALGGFVE